MARSYRAMREVLGAAAHAGKPIGLDAFLGMQERDRVFEELQRLRGDALIDADVIFDREDVCLHCEVRGLTDEGWEFFRLVENESVWKIVRDVLDGAGVDVSYPLLKEVCEEIVKRYVVSFIPDI